MGSAINNNIEIIDFKFPTFQEARQTKFAWSVRIGEYKCEMHKLTETESEITYIIALCNNKINVSMTTLSESVSAYYININKRLSESEMNNELEKWCKETEDKINIDFKNYILRTYLKVKEQAVE